MTLAAVKKAVESLKPQIMAAKPLPQELSDIKIEDWLIKVTRQDLRPDQIFITSTLPTCKLVVGTAIDPATPSGMALLHKALGALTHMVAPELLLPQARQIAARLGCAPGRWKISGGKKVLGHCNSKKEISLSSMLTLFPRRLRRYVICHELAHLTHMNHSKAFHDLCNAYLEGKEKALSQELKHYKWPVLL